MAGSGEEVQHVDALLEELAEFQELDDEWEQSALPELPDSVTRSASLQYGALGGLYAVLGGAVAVAALQAPQLLVPPAASGSIPGAADAWVRVMLGCVAAAYVRAAGMCLHIKAAADRGELLLWRHQRLAVALAAWAAVAVLSQALGVASVPLLGLQAVVSVATLAVVVGVTRAVYGTSPFVAQELAGAQPWELPGLALGATLRSLGSVAGAVLWLVAGLSLWGFTSVVFAPSPALPHPLGSWPGLPDTLGPAEAGLRRMAGAGLLLAAAAAHALFDFSASVRQKPYLGDVDNVKEAIIMRVFQRYPHIVALWQPPPAAFTLLNLSLVAAAGLQAAFVASAPSLGVDVNWDAALWGPLYGTAFASLLYGLAVLFTVDWQAVAGAAWRVYAWFGGLVLSFFDRFVWKYEWAEAPRRR